MARLYVSVHRGRLAGRPVGQTNDAEGDQPRRIVSAPLADSHGRVLKSDDPLVSFFARAWPGHHCPPAADAVVRSKRSRVPAGPR